MDQDKWDRRFLRLAEHIASWSKDPSTKVGSVVVDGSRRIVSLGYNGFPAGVDDTDERYADRDMKYKLVVHAETNAILFAGRNLSGCTLYTWPFASCSRCAGLVIQSGIRRCVAPELPAALRDRWADDVKVTAMMFAEAGVVLDLITGVTDEPERVA